MEKPLSFVPRARFITPCGKMSLTLSSIIKKETGKTALKWLTMFTINLSKHYLTDTGMSIKAIANTLHFPNQSAFGGTTSKYHMGCSPGEYRKKGGAI